MSSDRGSKGTHGYQLEITAGTSVDVYSYSTLIDPELNNFSSTLTNCKYPLCLEYRDCETNVLFFFFRARNRRGCERRWVSGKQAREKKEGQKKRERVPFYNIDLVQDRRFPNPGKFYAYSYYDRLIAGKYISG